MLMKYLVFIAVILFSLPVAAKRAPKWKPGNFKTTASGLQYKIVKPGKSDSIREFDIVEVDFFFYVKEGEKYYRYKQENFSGNLDMNDEDIPKGAKEAMQLLRRGGKGYFVLPPSIGFDKKDSSLCFIRIKKIIRIENRFIGPKENVVPKDSVKTDSITITVNDPGKKYFGDTLFSVMTLVEKPQLLSCGSSKVLIAFKFEIRYFDHGTQRKNILVFIECPEVYGENYFVVGTSYVVTCVPLLDDLKTGNRTMNAYSLEKLENYYGLRVKKM
jgi:hypothetical protein